MTINVVPALLSSNTANSFMPIKVYLKRTNMNFLLMKENAIDKNKKLMLNSPSYQTSTNISARTNPRS